MNMYTDASAPFMLSTGRHSPEYRAETSQLMLGSATTALKRGPEANPSYMTLMSDQQAPKRARTSPSQGDVSSEIYSRYLKQQADFRGRESTASSLKQQAARLAQFPQVESRGNNTMPLTSNSFLVDRMTRQTNAGASSLLQGLNDPGFSMGSGLSNLMPGLNNKDMGGFGGSMSSFGNSNGLMLDSSMSARQRLGLTGMSTGTGMSSFSMQPRGDQSLLLEAAGLNNFQGSSRSIQLGSYLGSGLNQPDQTSLRGFNRDTTSLGLTSNLFASSTGMGQQMQFCGRVGGGVSPLPTVLARRDEDNRKLSEMQVFLREQIEVFEATQDDTTTHTRGRNKPIRLGQVGIRCRHCAHLPVVQRQKGSTYFPASLLGLYQAAQNMSSCHMQSGLCREMPEEIKAKFATFQNNKVTSSGAGRPYWAHSAKKFGLVDTPEDGIRFIGSISQS